MAIRRLVLLLIALALVAGALLSLPQALAAHLLGLGLLLTSVVLLVRGLWDILRLLRQGKLNLTLLLHQAAPPLRVVSAGVGIVLLLYAAWAFLPGQTLLLAQAGIMLTLIGGLALGALLCGDPLLSDHARSDHTRAAAAAPPVRWRWTLLGVCAVLVVVQVHFLLVARTHALISHHVQMALLLGGWGLMAWGLCGAPRLRWPRPRLTREGWALLLILLIALAVRGWNLAQGVHRWIDEINFLHAINDLSLFPSHGVLTPFGGITAFTWFFPYVQWWWQAIFGPSLDAVRMPAVLFGVAQVGALWWLMRPITGVRAALVGALLLAVFPPAVHFSRMGLNNVADPVFGMLALGFLVRAVASGSRAQYVMAGLMLGLTHYFYEGGRLFFTAFALCWLGWMTLFGARKVRFGRGALAGVFSLALVALPVYATWLFNDAPLLPRLASVGRGTPHMLELKEAVRSLPTPQADLSPLLGPLLSYVHLPDAGQFYRNDTGFILPVMVPFFLLGLVVCVWRWRTAAGSLFFWWCIGVAVGNLLLNNRVDAPRYVVVFPALCAVLGIGVHASWTWLERALPRLPWRAPALAGLAAVVISHSHYYHAHHLPMYYLRQFYYEQDIFRQVRVLDADDMIFRAVALRPPVEVYVFARGYLNTFAFPVTLSYFRLHEQDGYIFRWEYSDRARYALHQAPPSDRPQAFFVEPDDPDVLALIESRFTLHGPFWSPFPAPRARQFALYVTDLSVLPEGWQP